MYTDIPFWLSIVFMLGGLVALTWSSDFFVDGAAVLAKILGISPFVIGMVIIGFGTSAPELCVSAMSGISGHANLSLGNAYGSASFNIALILGTAALISPLVVKPLVSGVAVPILSLITVFTWILLRDGACSRSEALALLGAFFVLMPLYCWFDQRSKAENKVPSADEAVPDDAPHGVWGAIAKVMVGLAVLIGSSHVLVWGAVDFARFLHVSDLVIGLTIVAVGTSLPELASAVASARRGEHEFVLGNIIGSNLFNTLAVVGIATAISPVTPENGGFSPYILTRDLPYLAALSVSVALFGLNWRKPREPGLVTRRLAVVWILSFVVYTVFMFFQEVNVNV